MFRNSYPQAPLNCSRAPNLVDQYMWPEKDTTHRVCTTGVGLPIYDGLGNVRRSLPLHMYPPAGSYHPEWEEAERQRRIRALEAERTANREGYTSGSQPITRSRTPKIPEWDPPVGPPPHQDRFFRTRRVRHL